MKNFAFILLLIVLISSSCSLQDDQPDPALLKAMNDTSGGVPFEQNAYIGLCGFNTASGGDFIRNGLDIITRANRGESIEQNKYDLVLQDAYRNPCFDSDNTNCISQIVEDTDKIKESIENNKELIDRYYTIQNMPFYRNTGNSINFLPKVSDLMYISYMLSSASVLSMINDNVDISLNFIEKDLLFYKKIFYAERSSLLERMLAVVMIDKYNYLISHIIELGTIDIAEHKDILRRILTPLENVGKHMADAYYTESILYAGGVYNKIDLYKEMEGSSFQLRFYMYLLIHLQYPVYKNVLLDHLLREYKISYILSNKLYLSRKLLAFFSYKENKTMHLFYEENKKSVRKIAALQILGFDEQYEKLQKPATDYFVSLILYPATLYQRYGLFPLTNIWGEFNLSPLKQNTYDFFYLARAFDSVAYAHLVRAQLEWSLLVEKPDDPADILENLGPETLNPYTGRSFQWDPSNWTLRFSSMASGSDYKVNLSD